jgi:hypothetical protein
MFGSAFPPLPSSGVHPECVYDLYPIGRLNRPHEPTKHLLNRTSRESDTQITADEAEAFVSSRLLMFQQAGRRVDRDDSRFPIDNSLTHRLAAGGRLVIVALSP